MIYPYFCYPHINQLTNWHNNQTVELPKFCKDTFFHAEWNYHFSSSFYYQTPNLSFFKFPNKELILTFTRREFIPKCPLEYS
jgi:hypothetical protein